MPKTYYSCPICEEPVHEVFPRAEDLIEFSCPTCGQFRISKTSIKSLKEKSRADREALLSDARRNAQGGEGASIVSANGLSAEGGYRDD